HLFATVTDPARLRAPAPVVVASGRLGARRLGRRLPDSSRLGALMRLTPDARLRDAARGLPELTRARGERRGRVGLLQGCVQRVFFHGVNVATVDVLAAHGYDVTAPRRPRCCGALFLHSGEEPAALALARELIASFADCDYVAVNAAGCGSSMRDYGHLLADDPAWAESARAFAAKVRDVSELLVAGESAEARREVRLRVAYHDACHLAHAQGIRSEPRRVLESVPGLELVEPPEWEICCGSAGIYNLTERRAGAELGRRKVANLIATGAEAIAAGNPGCALQIRTYLEEAGHPLPVYHPVELVRMSFDGVVCDD
ncbi:MAG: (Fe-S)-binding protein, partial [Actinobacteria bacterium]|nr:(Fe-S)-binding protein [Actinomycetota bacterium]